MTELHDDNQQKEPEIAGIRSEKAVPSLGMVLLLVALGGAGYAVYTTTMLRQGVQQQLQAVSATVETMKTQQKQATDELSSGLKFVDASQEKMAMLEKQFQTALQQQTYQANDWALLKARYYLELAQINAYWIDNPEAISALLTQADALLLNSHDQRLFDVRRAITEENVQVQSIEKIDLMGILSQLESAQETANQLIVNAARSSQTESAALSADKTAASRTAETWRQRLNHSLSLLEKLVVIRHADEDIQPLVTPAYAAMLRENVKLMLQETQLAVLQHSDALYQFTLKQAVKKIKQSFDSQDANTQNLLKQLDELQKVDLSPKKPETGQALLLLNQVINSKQLSSPEEIQSGNTQHD